MPTTPFTNLEREWRIDQRYQAQVEQGIRLNNNSPARRGGPIYWEIYTTGELPAISIKEAQKLYPGQSVEITLSANEYLAIAGEVKTSAALTT
jgi:hypothetical protein